MDEAACKLRLDEIAQTCTHTQRHMNNAWNEMGSCSPWFVLVAFLIFFHSCKEYGIISILFLLPFWPYYDLIVSHASFIIFLFFNVQSKALPSTLPILLHCFEIHIVPKIQGCQQHFNFGLPNVEISYIQLVNDSSRLILKWCNSTPGDIFKNT